MFKYAKPTIPLGLLHDIEELESLPSRGAWIEMLQYQSRTQRVKVAPLAGSVD